MFDGLWCIDDAPVDQLNLHGLASIGRSRPIVGRELWELAHDDVERPNANDIILVRDKIGGSGNSEVGRVVIPVDLSTQRFTKGLYKNSIYNQQLALDFSKGRRRSALLHRRFGLGCPCR
jgi:hypothetical protein